MSICRDCGQEVTFRYINGVCVPMHASGDCGEWSIDEDAVSKTTHIKYPPCGQMVWLVRHNGGSVSLDELGLPWPKHRCFDSESSGTNSTPPYTLSDLNVYAKERRCQFFPPMVKPWLDGSHSVGVHNFSSAVIIRLKLSRRLRRCGSRKNGKRAMSSMNPIPETLLKPRNEPSRRDVIHSARPLH